MNLGVEWHKPHPKGGYYKRSFASTTQASSDLLYLLSCDGLTWKEGMEQVNYDPEAKAICSQFVEWGYGSVPMSTHLGSIVEPTLDSEM